MKAFGNRFGLGLIAALVFNLAALAPGSASAAPVITSYSASLSALQAAGHPDSALSFRLATEETGQPVTIPGLSMGARAVAGGSPKSVTVVLPRGLYGNVQNIPFCSTAELTGVVCPIASQVGRLTAHTILGGVPNSAEVSPFGAGISPSRSGLFNLAPQRGELARFGARAANSANVLVSVRLRPGDYRLVATTSNIWDGLAAWGSDVTIWGNPYDPGHDAERFCDSQATGCSVGGLPSLPLMVAPSECGVDGAVSIQIDTWQRPGDFATAISSPQQVSGCGRLSFDPRAEVAPVNREADSPSGLEVSLEVPQHFDNPAGLETPPLRKVVVKLPQGVSVNPSSAAGLAACSMRQVGISPDGVANGDPVECPMASKIGSLTATTPALEEELTGSVYLAAQRANPFGSLIAIYLTIENPERGVLVKLAGRVDADPESGQLTATFDDNPQLPVGTVDLRLKSGPRAPLRMPSACGTYESHVQMISWAGQRRQVTSSFGVAQGPGGRPCPSGGFEPAFEAGTTSPMAASFSPFLLKVSREDGSQQLRDLSVTLPQGLLGKLAGVPYCPDSVLAGIAGSEGTGAGQFANPSCPQASQVGVVTVGAGAGSLPFQVETGKAYLAGPYKGAPLSLAVVTPAIAGPFDLGTVTVRNTINVDPTTAQVSVKSDPLPQILQGIPIAYRDIRVDVDKPQFTLNPTSCDPMEVKGTIGSSQGAEAKVADRFQVANCANLAFKPKLTLSVKGPTHRSAHPRLKAVLTMPNGGANIEKAQVTLPKTEILENAHIRTICTRVQYAAQGGGGKACPPASVYGKAKAWSPLLDKPLEGPVFLRSSSNPLPDLVASLDGQIHVDLVGRIDSVNARIRNTFEGVPDAPVSKFVLEMQGGKKGLLVNNTELCKTTPRATVKFDGQNGKLADSSPVMRADCGKKAKKGGAKKKR